MSEQKRKGNSQIMLGFGKFDIWPESPNSNGASTAHKTLLFPNEVAKHGAMYITATTPPCVHAFEFI